MVCHTHGDGHSSGLRIGLGFGLGLETRVLQFYLNITYLFQLLCKIMLCPRVCVFLLCLNRAACFADLRGMIYHIFAFIFNALLLQSHERCVVLVREKCE